jgi:hypothetical protein
MTKNYKKRRDVVSKRKHDGRRQPRKGEEFDKVRELKYISLWAGILAVTIAVLKYYEVGELALSISIILNTILLVSNYLKSREIEHLKNGKEK